MHSEQAKKIEQAIRQGYQARRERRPEAAAEWFREAIKEGRAQSMPSELAQALKGLGQIERDGGQIDLGITRYEEALAIERSLGEAQRIAHTLRHLADMHQDRERSNLAKPYYEEAMRIYRSESGTGALDLANAMLGYSRCRHSRDDVRGAIALLEEARSIYAELGIAAGVEDCDGRLQRLRQ